MHDLVVGKPVHGEVLAELAVAGVVPLQLLLPVAVGVQLVDQHGTLLATVSGEVALPVAVQIQPPRHHGRGDGLLPDTRVDDLAVPGDVLGQPDVHGDQGGHPVYPPCLYG